MDGQLVCRSLMASLSALLDGLASIWCLEPISMEGCLWHDIPKPFEPPRLLRRFST